LSRGLQVSLRIVDLDRTLAVNHHRDYLRQETEREIEIGKEIAIVTEIVIVIEIVIEIVICCLDIDHLLDHLQGT